MYAYYRICHFTRLIPASACTPYMAVQTTVYYTYDHNSRKLIFICKHSIRSQLQDLSTPENKNAKYKASCRFINNINYNDN